MKILTIPPPPPPSQNAAYRSPLQLRGADIIRRLFVLAWDIIFDPVHKTMLVFCTAANVRLLRVAWTTLDDNNESYPHNHTQLMIRFNIILPYTPWSPNWTRNFAFSER
jgi:hypothetical protein